MCLKRLHPVADQEPRGGGAAPHSGPRGSQAFQLPPPPGLPCALALRGGPRAPCTTHVSRPATSTSPSRSWDSGGTGRAPGHTGVLGLVLPPSGALGWGRGSSWGPRPRSPLCPGAPLGRGYRTGWTPRTRARGPPRAGRGWGGRKWGPARRPRLTPYPSGGPRRARPTRTGARAHQGAPALRGTGRDLRVPPRARTRAHARPRVPWGLGRARICVSARVRPAWVRPPRSGVVARGSACSGGLRASTQVRVPSVGAGPPDPPRRRLGPSWADAVLPGGRAGPRHPDGCTPGHPGNRLGWLRDQPPGPGAVMGNPRGLQQPRGSFHHY